MAERGKHGGIIFKLIVIVILIIIAALLYGVIKLYPFLKGFFGG